MNDAVTPQPRMGWGSQTETRLDRFLECWFPCTKRKKGVTCKNLLSTLKTRALFIVWTLFPIRQNRFQRLGPGV